MNAGAIAQAAAERHIPYDSRLVAGLRLAVLYLRSRKTLISLALIVACAVAAWWLRDWVGRASLNNPPDPMRSAVLVQVLPPLVAGAIGVGVWSPFGEPERTAARWLPLLRLGHVLGLLAIGCAVLAVSVDMWTNPTPDIGMARISVRNAIGLTGLAVLVGRFIDARLSWIAPFLWAAIAAYSMLGADYDPMSEDWIWSQPDWLWMAQPDDSTLAWLIAVGLGIAGLAVTTLYGAREFAGEDE